MAERSQFIGRLAGLTQILFAVIIGGVASLGYEVGVIPRGVVLLVLYSLPGVVGLVGVASRRPALLVAAALISFVGSFIAFSGVTLIFIVPAAMLLVGAVQIAVHGRPDPTEGWLARFLQVGLAAAIVVLVIGAGASALLVTDSGCWTEYRTDLGVRIETGPYSTGEMEVPAGATMTGCSTGLISLRGVGLGGLLGSAALGLALVVARRRTAPVA